MCNSISKAINFSPMTESEGARWHIVLTSYGLGNREIVVWIPGGVSTFSSSCRKLQQELWGPTSFLLKGNAWYLPGVKSRWDVNLNTHLLWLPELTMSIIIFLLFHAFVARSGTTFTLALDAKVHYRVQQPVREPHK